MLSLEKKLRETLLLNNCLKGGWSQMGTGLVSEVTRDRTRGQSQAVLGDV